MAVHGAGVWLANVIAFNLYYLLCIFTCKGRNHTVHSRSHCLQSLTHTHTVTGCSVGQQLFVYARLYCVVIDNAKATCIGRA